MFQDGSGGGPTDSPLTLGRPGVRLRRPQTVTTLCKQCAEVDSAATSRDPGRRHSVLGPTTCPLRRAITPHAEARGHLPAELMTADRAGRGARPGESAHGVRERCSEGTVTDESDTKRQATERRAEFPGQTLRIHPFASMRFHVLLNSLFKVLFNFPSRYLSAIGLVPVFSLRWSLPSALGCILKQPDSEEARRQRARRQKGPDTRYGRGHDQEDLGDEAHHQSASYTPHFPPTLRRGIRCWALPASLAVTRGILVSFFSSAY